MNQSGDHTLATLVKTVDALFGDPKSEKCTLIVLPGSDIFFGTLTAKY